MGNHQLVLFTPLGEGAIRVTATVAGYPDWQVLAVVVPAVSGPTVSELLVRPSSNVELPAGGIPARLVRKINPGELLQLAQHRAASDSGGARQLLDTYGSSDQTDAVTAWMRSYVDATTAMAIPRKRPGRSGNGLEHYAVWAVRYVQKVQAGERHPIAALARDHHKELGREQDKAETYIRDTVTDARRRYQLLTKPGQGKAGGQLTAKAHKVLAGIGNREETGNG